MDETKTTRKKPLTEDEIIQELMELLKQNNMQSQSNDVFEICSYVDGLEKKLDSVTEELTKVREQIKEMQEDTLLNNLKKSVTEAADRLNHPEASWSLPLNVVHVGYGIYLFAMIILFIAPFKKK